MPATLNNTGVLFNDSSQQNTSFLGESAQVFTSSGTFTIPSGVTKVKVTVVGGGGGSAGTADGNSGGGGGGGGVAFKWLTSLTPTNTITVTVGAGGTAGTSGPGNGGAGGNSSVASGTQTITTVTANGGGAGLAGGTNGDGGTATNGDLNFKGEKNGQSGHGGGNIYANSVPAPAVNGAAVAGLNYGGGASGTTSNSGNLVGAVGAGGFVLFEW